MHPSSVRSRLVAAAMALVAVACSYPTDSSTGAFVTIAAPQVLIRGNDTLLTAHVYLLQHGHDTVEVKNVDVTWTSSDPKLATITALPGRQARVTGVKPGIDTITAVAATLQSASAGRKPLRIADPFEPDSVRPRQRMYGEQLTVYGVGAENVDLLLFNSTQLVLDPWSGQADTATGSGKRNFWVEFPARHVRFKSDTLALIGNGIVATLYDSIAVDGTRDLFDSFPAAPSHVDIGGLQYHDSTPHPPDFRDIIAFYNPALFAEDPGVASVKFDWFRFVTLTPNSAYTFIYSAPGLLNRQVTFLSAPVTPATLLSGDWSYGSGHYNCKGYAFTAAEVPNDGFAVAFTALPPGGADLVSLFADRGQYLLAVVHGYATAEPIIRPDRFEGDNTCDLADANFANPALHIDLAAPFGDTLNIDNAFEIDWLRFHVPGAGPQTVTVKLHSKSYAQVAVNPSDIVLYVTNVPTTVVPLSVLKSALAGGTSKSLTVSLNPGDYYLVVHDSVGVPARYTVCMAVGVTCVLPALPDVVAGAWQGAPGAFVDVRPLLAHPKKRRAPQ